MIKKKKQTPRPEFESELYRLIERRLSSKLVPTFADRGRHVVSVTDPLGRILGFLDRSVDDRIINIHGSICGVKNDRVNGSTQRKSGRVPFYPQFYCHYHKNTVRVISFM
jgi:hypothetical protein